MPHAPQPRPALPRRSRTGLTAALLLLLACALAPVPAQAPNDAEFQHALELSKSGKHLDAIAAWTVYSKTHPKDARAYVNRGNVKRDQGEKGAAISDFTRAINIDPKNAGAFYNRGLTEAEMGHQDSALVDYTRALELDAHLYEAYSNRGNIWRELGHADRALADFARALENNPQYPPAYASRGHLRRELGELESALADFNQALALTPTNARFYTGRGSVFYFMGDWPKAGADFDLAGRQDPPDPFAWLYAYVVQQRLGHSEEDRKLLRERIAPRRKEKPGDWVSQIAVFLLGESSEEKLLDAATIATAEPRVTRTRQCAAWYFIGMQRLAAGKKPEATEAFHKCLALGLRTYTEHQLSIAELKTLEPH